MGLKKRIALQIEVSRLVVHWFCLMALTGILILYNRLTKARFKRAVW